MNHFTLSDEELYWQYRREVTDRLVAAHQLVTNTPPHNAPPLLAMASAIRLVRTALEWHYGFRAYDR